MDPDRLPLHNLEAERGALGSMLLDNAAILEVSDILRPEDFYRDSHQVIYRTILATHQAGKPVDAITLIDELTRRGQFKDVGGDDAIVELLESPPHAANARYYAEIVQQKATARELAESSLQTLREIASESHSADELVELSERRIRDIGQSGSRQEALSIAEASREVMGRIHNRRTDHTAGALASGFGDIDDLLGGFRPGQMIVLAARPSMGKTALALGIAEHVAARAGLGVLFISLEMGQDEIVERFLVLRSGVRMSKVQQPRFATEDELRRLEEAVPPEGMPLWVDDSSSLTPTQVSAISRRHHTRQGIGLLVVDYLQLLSPDDPRTPRHEQVAATSRRLKALAKEIGAPVLALSQLNRESEKREDRTPRMADLRESGQIEQDADVVMLLHRPEYYDPKDRPGTAELIVAKNRNGATTTIKMVFEKELMRFSDVEHRLDPAF